MAREIDKGDTVIDYLNALIQAAELTERKCEGIALTTPEWAQFKAFLKVNPALNAAAEEVDDTLVIFRGIRVFYDGCHGGKVQYIDDLRGYKEFIRDAHGEALNPALRNAPTPRNALPPNPVRRWATGYAAPQPGGLVAGQAWVNEFVHTIAQPATRTRGDIPEPQINYQTMEDDEA